MSNRRGFLKVMGLGFVAIAITWFTVASIPKEAIENNKVKFKLGIASYSFKGFSQEKALDMTMRCGVDIVAFKSMHLPLDADKETIDKAPDVKDCIIGHGFINYPPILKTLIKLGYSGTLALEFELDRMDPLPGMMESFG